jgi:SAM-dependent methyltransferase
MLERAKRRLASTADAGRVGFTCADLRSFVPEAGKFDAVATFFVLDCFGPDEVAAIVARASAALRPGAQWLFADFVLPPRGFARARARAWLALLYAFFRWETGLRVSALPPSEEILQRAGWFPLDSCDYQGGMVRSAVLIAPGERPGRLR